MNHRDPPRVQPPSEMLRERGASALTDEELVAAILGCGMADIDVRTLARHVTAVPRIKLDWG